MAATSSREALFTALNILLLTVFGHDSSIHVDDVPLIDQILPYIPHEDVAEFCDVDILNMTTWNDTDDDYLDILNETLTMAKADCTDLDLSNSDCFSDCIYYTNPTLWLLLLLDDTDESRATLERMLSYYTSSAVDFTPSIQWYGLGDPDSCTLNEGTYCYTAAITGGLTVNGHGCWYVIIPRFLSISI